MKTRAILFFLLTFLVCAGPTLSAPASGRLPAVLIDVPYVAQTRDGCGSAAISMVMRYWDSRSVQVERSGPNPADPKRIQSELYSRAARGIPASSMKRYFLDSGYRSVDFAGDWNDLQHHIREGRPLIVALRASGRLGPLHYVVVTGIDTDGQYVYVHDPAQQESLRMSREGFESEWKPMHNWTLLAVPQPAD
jgi:predicted double-glycine peptidase